MTLKHSFDLINEGQFVAEPSAGANIILPPLQRWRQGPRSAALMVFGTMFLAVQFFIRLLLLINAAGDVELSAKALLGVFSVGLFYDVIAASYCALPLVLYLVFCPAKWLWQPWHKTALLGVHFVVLYLLLFVAAAELLFWNEFGARFNFIAVDYLIYTNEVIGNIRESYSLPLIFGGLFVATLIGFAGLSWLGFFRPPQNVGKTEDVTLRLRLKNLIAFLLLPLLFTIFVNGRQVPTFGNTYSQELARNGIYSFFAEFRNNELSYNQFYNTLETRELFGRVRDLLASDDATFLSTNLTDLTKMITHPGAEKRWNVIQITVESLSADFLGAFGSAKHLTPNLDSLAEESLFFTNFFATGTRTVRGMEALTLSLPPTPGQSIIRRPKNENLFSLGSVFRERGYDTAFIYGGYGYFDNMNKFFSKNGYRVIDRSSVPSSAITFANVWGACDEDSLAWSLKEADEAFLRKRPFFHFVMTTSNHRPYTYPENRIDIPSHSGREGGVKYTDYSIGHFIEKARTRPWFSNTLFVIVADHCAASAGRTDLPIKRYEIPLIIYNPSLVPARRIPTLCSQIDYPPTLLGLMNWTYQSRFFGKDILKMKAEEERAFIASYQKLGILNRNRLAILKPVRDHNAYCYDRKSGSLKAVQDDVLTKDGIAYYQAASYLFSHGLYQALEKQ